MAPAPVRWRRADGGHVWGLYWSTFFLIDRPHSWGDLSKARWDSIIIIIITLHDNNLIWSIFWKGVKFGISGQQEKEIICRMSSRKPQGEAENKKKHLLHVAKTQQIWETIQEDMTAWELNHLAWLLPSLNVCFSDFFFFLADTLMRRGLQESNLTSRVSITDLGET